jgi:hypothetical protein
MLSVAVKQWICTGQLNVSSVPPGRCITALRYHRQRISLLSESAPSQQIDDTRNEKGHQCEVTLSRATQLDATLTNPECRSCRASD